jgi:tight adherence protein C
MISMVGLGAALGASVFVLLLALVPQRVSLPEQLARFDARPSISDQEPAYARRGPVAQARARLGMMLALWLARRGITYPRLRQDLAMTGRTFEEVMARKALAFVSGFLAVVAAAVVLHASTGLTLPVVSPAVLALGVGTGLFFVPDLREHRHAAGLRREFRRAVGSWLDLVALEMAGSAAPAEALPTAARVSTEWPMIVIGDILYRATAAGQDHWEALADLGQHLGIPELIDLATLTRLVGRDGARVRETLTARAASMRRALLADTETQAGQHDQSMIIAQILIGFGFILFVMYPALVNVLQT